MRDLAGVASEGAEGPRAKGAEGWPWRAPSSEMPSSGANFLHPGACEESEQPRESARYVPGAVGDEDRAALDRLAEELDAAAEPGDRRANQPRCIEGARRRSEITTSDLGVGSGWDNRSHEERRGGSVRVGRHRRRVSYHQAARQVAEQHAHLPLAHASQNPFYSRLCPGGAKTGNARPRALTEYEE